MSMYQIQQTTKSKKSKIIIFDLLSPQWP